MRHGDADTLHAVCRAKVNLTLRVGAPIGSGDRAGYHPIRSWIHAIDLHDTLSVRRAGSTSFDPAWSSGEPVAWDLGQDLVMRAQKALEGHVGRTLPAAITLRKSIPEGAGLGGGSSDAAGLLRALDAIYGLGLGSETLRSIGQRVGSDVPFFIDQGHDPPRPALVSGFGDELERLGRRAEPITLVVPAFGCATGRVYDAFDRLGVFTDDLAASDQVLGRDPIAWDELVNDLTPPALTVEPRLATLAAALRDALGPPVVMTGSGSTLMIPGAPEIPADALGGARVIRARLV